ncbi:hypothetical protein TNCT_99581 [Trichonephila clavata]|uniref:Uncharacterized protein n=1 Tax=Trichonephila clavata TaxID=2740835 RepID=A0A8X6G9E1_TRICU|nr:hypothetical protein TNCT_99581 [Trichonephila clavata]
MSNKDLNLSLRCSDSCVKILEGMEQLGNHRTSTTNIGVRDPIATKCSLSSHVERISLVGPSSTEQQNQENKMPVLGLLWEPNTDLLTCDPEYFTEQRYVLNGTFVNFAKDI